jgi:ferritin
MLSKTMEAAINEQIKHEFYSAYFYLSMAAYCESNNLFGSAKWLKMQAGEEQEHALKFFGHVLDRGGKVTLQAIPQPPAEYTSLVDVFEQVLAHEQKVTALITRLYELAVKENDYPTQFLLQWFINEQVEEEQNGTTIVEMLRMVGSQPQGLFMIDSKLGARAAKG